MPATAVVFTGQFNRLQHGVDLLKADAIQTLLVSGFNAGAGLQLNTLGTQFSIAPGVLNGWLKNGRLLLGTQANSTLENAVEVKHMLAAGNLDRLVLITGECHMPRASLLLEGELRDVSIQRLPVAGGCETPELVANEFLKYLYSFAYRMGGIFI